jgi:hypothetical protein
VDIDQVVGHGRMVAGSPAACIAGNTEWVRSRRASPSHL